MVQAKKYLGQHFLKDEEICLAIAEGMSETEANQKILEIGPGRGAITKYLIEKYPNLSVVEVDGDSISFLSETYPTLDVIDFDFLKLNLAEINEGKEFKIFGNFPYFISAQILTKIFENRNYVSEVVGMFQKEVSEKVNAQPGNRNYSIISVFIQAFFTVEYLFTVPEDAFDPPPKVKSGVIRLVRNGVDSLEITDSTFKQVVKLGFNQRRKTLRNSLKSILPESVREEAILNKRPEQLEVQDFIDIGKMIENNQ